MDWTQIVNRLVMNAVLLGAVACQSAGPARPQTDSERPNVLFIIADDLTATALSCYGSTVSQTPNIDRLAARGTRFTRAYSQFPVCGPSRASFMSGYYPHATGVFGYTSGREGIGDRSTWAEHFKGHGYHTARVSKIFHMGVPGDIETGSDGQDDPRSWTERFNSQGPEWKAAGVAELLEGNADRTRVPKGGNRFAYVQAEGGMRVHSDGRTAAQGVTLLEQRAQAEEPFFLALGFVRPHVPFVAPAEFYEPYPFEAQVLPGSQAGWEQTPPDWSDIPRAGINYKTSRNMQMDVAQRRASIGSYYASVAFVDALVGEVLDALERLELDDDTIVIFTSDHGFHLGEHDFWAKVSLHEESVRVPLIIAGPSWEPQVCASFVELLDLYPTIAQACNLPVPKRLQGHNLVPLLEDGTRSVRSQVFAVNGRDKGYLLRDERWAFLQYGERGRRGAELYDMQNDPKQLTNLAELPSHADIVGALRQRLKAKLIAVRTNDLAR